jgi:5'-nucleotidase
MGILATFYMNKPIALIDLDGTLADFDGAMLAALKKLAAPGEEVNTDQTNELPHIKARRRLIKSVPGFWSGLPRIEDGFIVLNILRVMGFSLNILSKGPNSNPKAWAEKVQWAQREVPDAAVTITEDKSLTYGKVLFDDWPGYVEPWLEHRPRGLVIMIEHEWNQDYYHARVFKWRRQNKPYINGPEWVAAVNAHAAQADELRNRLRAVL